MGKHDPCFDHPLVILSLLCPLNLSPSLFASLLSPPPLCLHRSPFGSSYSPHLISPVMTNTSISLQPFLRNAASPSHFSNLTCRLYFPLKMRWPCRRASLFSVLLCCLDRMAHMSTLYSQKWAAHPNITPYSWCFLNI